MRFAELEELALSWSPESRESFRRVRKLLEGSDSLDNDIALTSNGPALNWLKIVARRSLIAGNSGMKSCLGRV